MSFFIPVSHEEDAPVEHSCVNSSAELTDSWHNGLKGEPHPGVTGAGSFLSTAIVIVLAVLALNFKHCRRLIKNIPSDLLRYRASANTFDNHTTSENRTYIILLFLLFISEGILMVACANTASVSVPPDMLVAASLAMAAVAAGLYLFQLCSYAIVGFAFAPPQSTGQWLRGFNASQALLALLIFLPALLAIVYPGSALILITIVAVAYILTRILFIFKGFRIFYNNFPSILYFILYLCTLEIVPLLIVAKIAKGILVNL